MTKKMNDFETIVQRYGDYLVYVDYEGDEQTENEAREQYEEDWSCGLVVIPISNAIVHMYVVTTSKHSDHHGFDATECVEAVAMYQNEDFSELLETMENGAGYVEQFNRRDD